MKSVEEIFYIHWFILMYLITNIWLRNDFIVIKTSINQSWHLVQIGKSKNKLIDTLIMKT